ncbi:hypothetical protein SAMN04487949_2534 [Halogranum gelatinilyticum]|uniref:DUF7344 domain-containing protein n=2 Tax=Halogranum gelatinilyticum TaxID=660521 RepID=A0A1G9VX81_9EURY|nr:hypothetical protein SAMN04487949_2534 [Halogranum gelatinilyticum]
MSMKQVGADTETLPREVVFDMLSSQRRRHTLHYLLQHDRPVELRELSRQVAAWENGIEPVEVTSDQRKNVYTALRQAHLPRMDRAGIVDFDPNRAEIELREEASDLQLYLEVIPGNDIPWSDYYLGLSVFSGLLIGAAEFGVFPFGEIQVVAWTGLVVFLFFASAATHAYMNRQMRLGQEGPPPGYEQELQQEDE